MRSLAGAYGMVCIASFSLPQAASADDRFGANHPSEGGWRLCDTFTAHIENDEVGGSDRHYTSGARLACARPAPAFLARRLRSRLPKNALSRQRATYGIGQNIYTPDDIADPGLIEDDQPYAGWLYLDFGLESETRASSGAIGHLDQFGLQIGVVGPLSRAEQVQRSLHDAIDAREPAGWDNQLGNEFGLNLFYSRQWTGAGRFDLVGPESSPWLTADITPKFGAALGNVHIFGAGGLTLRIGRFPDDDHGPPAIRPSFPGSDSFSQQGGWSAYLFGGVEGRWVLRNIFLDGNGFDDDSPSVDKNRLVGEARLGAAVSAGCLRLAYAHVFRSQEFEGQDPQTYGGLTLSFAF